jgi:hypothetical protein
MATYKRIDGDYNIISLNATDNVLIDTNTVTIAGNLDVTCNLTYINVTELNIKAPFILLNSSNTGSYEANSGVLTHTSANTFAGLRYNNNSALWEVSTSTNTTGTSGTWTQIALGNVSVPGSNTQVIYNSSGAFGADADFTFDSAANKLTLQGHMVYGNIGSTPVAVANSAAIYNKAEGGGGTGVYVKSTTVDDELVSKSKAIVYGIIF